MYRLLDHPAVYRLSQNVLAPGGERIYTDHLNRLLKRLPGAAHLLDVGSGPESWLSRVGLNPIGLDVTHAYMAAYRRRGGVAVRASADQLPIAHACMDGVWTMFLLHHLPDDCARNVIKEMIRVCKDDGRVVVIDAVLPVSWWKRPIAHTIRRLDRGRHMRTQSQLVSLLPDSERWAIQRDELCRRIVGLEMLTCICTPTDIRDT